MAAMAATLLTGVIINSCTKDSSSSTTPADPCNGITCQNGGTCSNGTCICPTGWTGTYCQTPVTTTASKGNIQFVNNSNNPYAVYIGGVLQTSLAGKHTITYSVNVGTYLCEVIQQSGYLVTATDEKFNANVTNGGTQVVSFP